MINVNFITKVESSEKNHLLRFEKKNEVSNFYFNEV